MKKYLIIITLSLTVVFAKAQSKDSISKASTEEIHTKVDQNPAYPGGVMEFYKFLAHTLRYPSAAREKNIQGKVFVMFVVEKDGSLSTFKILKSLSDDIDKEAVRALELSPKWEPGLLSGHPVRTYYTVPISFTLGK